MALLSFPPDQAMPQLVGRAVGLEGLDGELDALGHLQALSAGGEDVALAKMVSHVVGSLEKAELRLVAGLFAVRQERDRSGGRRLSRRVARLATSFGWPVPHGGGAHGRSGSFFCVAAWRVTCHADQLRKS